MHVTCVLNACHTRSERGSDACVIELVAGLYRSSLQFDMCISWDLMVLEIVRTYT